MHERDRALFELGRIQRRVVLAHYLNADPASLEFTAGPNGKPVLVPADGQAVNFNTSHSGGMAVIAVVLDPAAAVGVDIERLDRSVPDSLWPACLSPGEAKWLAARPSAMRPADFMRLWTCKEAILKASGQGLRVDPASIDIDPESFAIRRLPASLGNGKDYHAEVCDLMDEYSLAVCIIGAGAHRMQLDILNDGA